MQGDDAGFSSPELAVPMEGNRAIFGGLFSAIFFVGFGHFLPIFFVTAGLFFATLDNF